MCDDDRVVAEYSVVTGVVGVGGVCGTPHSNYMPHTKNDGVVVVVAAATVKNIINYQKPSLARSYIAVKKLYVMINFKKNFFLPVGFFDKLV